MNIHHDLEKIKNVAIHYAKEHNCNYNIILMNPNENNEFDLSCGSTYEYVTDSYFEKPRPNVIRLCTTNYLIRNKTVVTMMDAMEEKKLTEEQETERIINHFSKIPDGWDEMQETLKMVNVSMKSDGNVNKLKKGLSAIERQADGIKYGKSGDRLPNTNRNDKCSCGSGKKFKKCCGK